MRRWNVARYKATWPSTTALARGERMNRRMDGARRVYAGVQARDARNLSEGREPKYSRKRRSEREENRRRKRPIHLGAPSAAAIGPSWVRLHRDWTALFTSWYPGALETRGIEGGTERRDKRRHYCKGLHLAGRGL